jgi:hypothetical protein
MKNFETLLEDMRSALHLLKKTTFHMNVLEMPENMMSEYEAAYLVAMNSLNYFLNLNIIETLKTEQEQLLVKLHDVKKTLQEYQEQVGATKP